MAFIAKMPDTAECRLPGHFPLSPCYPSDMKCFLTLMRWVIILRGMSVPPTAAETSPKFLDGLVGRLVTLLASSRLRDPLRTLWLYGMREKRFCMGEPNLTDTGDNLGSARVYFGLAFLTEFSRSQSRSSATIDVYLDVATFDRQGDRDLSAGRNFTANF
ncbi:uncharacterized protein BT62DRAFT_1012163 [Guyanagaster necrorhizus]|uniref:Uncharacterized protein n=1 Tax=Guyanagaster necrorhizus TaxID=856835 RepID=A0A9P7VJ72_9AGAR|nr:uncharacterized protein BT62DRAFT_1012163 [Guyanagaster necrorhizus MCA 3950]KAG7440939.1 hypothetical protein BT62DRAFT_1012163 [Guyanagaster necrorhizus MCA 3950]